MKIEQERFASFPANLGYTTFLRYYSYSSFNVSKEYQENRIIVQKFKFGEYNSDVDSLLVMGINEVTLDNNANQFYICPIPYSSLVRNEQRYQKLLLRLSEITCCRNGYNLVAPKVNRKSVATGDIRDYSELLTSIEISNVEKKKIILELVTT